MFENVKPMQPTTPPQPPPATPAMPPPTVGQSPVKPLAPKSAEPPLADQAAMELFKRTGLSVKQKILLAAISALVLLVLIGGGIWLFLALDPFAEQSITTPTNENSINTTPTNTTNVNTVTNIPLQELDTDKDGVRDIDERRFGTNAEQTDSDADGLNDYLEIYQYKTKPTEADTDGDGYLDGNEVDNGYDPNGPGRL